MKSPNETKVDRITTNLTIELGSQYREIARRLDIPVAELIRRVLDDEIDRVEKLTHALNSRRSA